MPWPLQKESGNWRKPRLEPRVSRLPKTTKVVHPPDVGTAISFAFRVGAESDLVLFGLALGIMVVLVILEQVTVWQLARWNAD